MKKILFIALLLLFSLTAGAQTGSRIAAETLRAAATEPAAKTYPDADVLLVEDRTYQRYEADGSDRFDCDIAFKILTEKGRQEKSTVHLGYSAAYGSLRFTGAQVIKPDGSVTDIDLETQVREAISAGQMNANIYDPNHKTIRLSVPDLKIGDVLRYSYSGEHTKPVVPGTWSDVSTFEETFPTRRAVYEIDAPAARPLARIVLRDEIPGAVTFRQEEDGDRVRYRWEVRDVPRMFEEPKMPQRHTVVQRLLLSTIPDWETLSKWYWELSLPRLEAVNSNMVAKVEELTAGLSRQKKIEVIFRFVSQDIRYMGITIEDEAPGFEPHDVCLTFDNRYGVCRDKAALLAAMLRLAGFDARPVLIYVGPKKDPDVPQPWFNHAITAVRNEDGSWLLMDSTNENTRDLLPAYLSNRSYLVATPDGETLQTSAIVPPEKNLLTIEVDAALNEDNLITGEAVLHFNGINDTAYRGRLARLKPEEREPYFEERLKQALGSAELTRLDIQPANVRDTTEPLSITLRFEVKNALASGPDTALLQVPTLINHFGLFGRVLGNGTGLDERRYPLYTEITCGVAETVRLDLSRSGLSPVALPAYETVDDSELFIRRAITATNSLLISRADILLRTVEFSPEQYRALKQNLKTAERNARKRVILSSKGFPGADLAVLSEEVVYTFYDPYNWKETRTVRQKVLTYAGKREASDLKLTYNPAYQRTVLHSAAVTAPDGTVQHIDPEKEINVMDAKWAGEAPRYPAEKILVASLPGVEVGSVIEYSFTSVYHDLPFFSAMEPFAGLNPLVSKTVRIKAPHSMKFKFGNMDPAVIRRRTSHRNETAVYEWHTEDRAMIKKEDRLPPGWIIKPYLFISTGDMNRYADEVEKALLKAAGKNKTAAGKAKALIKGLKTRLEKITALRNFADRAIRDAGPGFSALPLSAVTPADQVLAEGYGNTGDRAVLLYALLDAAKLKPRFLLASGLPRIEGMSDPVIATFQRKPFDTVLVAVKDGDAVYYLGDSGQYAEPGTLFHSKQPALDLSTRKIIALPDPLPDAVQTTFYLNVQEDGNVQIRKETQFAGTEFEKFNKQFAQFTPEERKREHQNLLSRLSQSATADGELQTVIDHPGLLTFQADLPAYAVRDGGHLYLTLPAGLGDLLNLKASRRENPFYLEKPVRRTVFYEVALPDGWEPALAPKPFRVELPAGGGFVEMKTAMMRGRLVIMQTADLQPALIPTDEYHRLLQINDRLTEPAARAVLLRKK